VRFLFTLVVLSCAAACGSTRQGGSPSPDGGGSGQSGVLDCAWATSNNCWKAAVASASSCLPPAATQGTISPDGTTCTYAAGATISFQPPQVGNLGYVGLSRFQATAGGSPCLSYATDDAGGGSTLATPAGTMSLVADKATASFGLTCPDGTSYVVEGADAEAQLFSACPESVPGFDIATGGTTSPEGGTHQNLIVTLDGTDSDGGTRVFDCTN
jgi:hypothetical protein